MSEFILMVIKDSKILVKLFDSCKYTNGIITNNIDKVMYGSPFVMANRGPNQDEYHVMMSWAEHNASAIGTLEGHLDKETDRIIVYKKDIHPIIQNKILS